MEGVGTPVTQARNGHWTYGQRSMTPELKQQLSEQLYFLDLSLTNFSLNQKANKLGNKVIGKEIPIDISSEVEAKRIATCIRLLVHDTNNSNSLLGQMREKMRMNFLDTSSPNDGRLHSMTGMIGVKGSNYGQYFGVVAKVREDENLVVVPLFMQHLKDWYQSYNLIGFQKWWDQTVINIYGQELARKELILTIANKDGGAHIDTTYPEKYLLAKATALSLNINNQETKFLRNVVYASVAQIGWELLNSM